MYHWTDGPWIYSRNWLLVLDPHERWSASEEINKPRGPTWDVVGNQDSVEIQNHMKALGAFDFDHRLDFNETIIRIPLRTKAQKETSEISKHAISVGDIKTALTEFGQEIRAGGLLFLKHVRKVIIRIDDTIFLTAQIIEDDSRDTRYAPGLTVLEAPRKQVTDDEQIQRRNLNGLQATVRARPKADSSPRCVKDIRSRFSILRS